MAITVMLALGGALVLALTLMPALCRPLLTGNISEKDNFLMRWSRPAYAPSLRIAWTTRWGVVGGVVALL